MNTPLVTPTPARQRGITHGTSSSTLADVLERILDKGLVIAGDIKVKIADVELLTIQIRLLICSVDKAREMGIDWWTTSSYLNPKLAPATVQTDELAAGRIGTNYLDRDSVAIPLRQGKPVFGRPAMGKKLMAPIFSISVPLRDAQGTVTGVLVGTINLGKPNFFDNIVSRSYGSSGGYYLIARPYGLYVTATDKARVMQPLPAAGSNLFLDRVMQGYEGYGIAIGSSGVETLSAAKRIPSADWIIAAALPTVEAFHPVQDMLRRMFLAASLLTAVAGFVVWWLTSWMLRRQLSPLMTESRSLNAWPETGQAPLGLPSARGDEIAQMMRGFNRLLRINTQREAALTESEAFKRSILDSVEAEIAVLDREGVILAVNEPWHRFALENATAQEPGGGGLEIGANYLAVCANCTDRELPDATKAQIGIQAVLDGTVPKFSMEYGCHSPGQQRWFSMAALPLKGALQSGAVITHVNITERKAAEERIRNLAFSDPLTGLPNRRLLLDRLQQALATRSRRARHIALLMVDLDDFKVINDTLGHNQGDLLLKQAATRLTRCVRAGDTVARLGGDEFVLILEDLSEDALQATHQVRATAEKILATMAQIYHLEPVTYYSSASIGITLLGDQMESIDEPLKRADLAMYQAKTAGGNTLEFYCPQMQTDITTRVALETGLREAILCHHFTLHYQAQVDAERRITGAEALLRWQDPVRGLVLPAEFIPVAEKTGLIFPLGRWVLESACAQLALWARRPGLADLTMSVNVSARQFRQGDFVDQVLACLARSGVNPRRLKLELTESMLVSNVEDVITKMKKLQAHGVGFSLDDFGTGYSSLSYLKRLPLDQLKIDQSFVRDILVDIDDAAIARMVIALADTMGLQVIAEGVETRAQRDFLAGLGCNHYQGYLFGPPVALPDFEDLLLAGA